jgi:hypothetical protein
VNAIDVALELRFRFALVRHREDLITQFTSIVRKDDREPAVPGYETDSLALSRHRRRHAG